MNIKRLFLLFFGLLVSVTPSMAQATMTQVAGAIRESFPNGTAGVAVGEVIRAVFLRIRVNYSGNNVR